MLPSADGLVAALELLIGVLDLVELYGLADANPLKNGLDEAPTAAILACTFYDF